MNNQSFGSGQNMFGSSAPVIIDLTEIFENQNKDPTKMKAALCPAYGPPEVLEIGEYKKPSPKVDEILIMVISSTVNSADTRLRGFEISGLMKFVFRLAIGINKPRNPVLGTEFSGIVIQKGKKVKYFDLGDEVFGVTGFRFGAHAEYLTVKESGPVIPKPKHCSFAEAAAIPFGGQTALYFLEKAGIKSIIKPSVLIIGGTGSVGVAAIQICKYFKANTTVVCGSKGVELVRSFGIKKIILYDQKDFRETEEKFDIIFDTVGKSSFKQCKSLLKAGGIYKSVSGMEYVPDNKNQLYFLKSLVDKGAYKSVLDKRFSLNGIIDAHRYVGTGRKKGNVILEIGNIADVDELNRNSDSH